LPIRSWLPDGPDGVILATFDKEAGWAQRFGDILSTHFSLSLRWGSNETQLRIEFIDPFFEAPGWDEGELMGSSLTFWSILLI
jgi:hypothetical protein